MKKRIMMIAALMLAICNMVGAEDKVTISDFKISAGETKEVSVELENNEAYVAFQFDLYLPEGISVESYSIYRDRVPEQTTVDMAQMEDGAYRFISAAMSGEAMTGNSGGIVMLTVKASESVEKGDYTGYFRKVKLSKADATGPTFEEMSFAVTVIEPSVVTVKSCSREYGEANPTFEYTVTGGALEGEPVITCEAGPTSDVGNYTIKISKGSVTNYNVTWVDGTLTIFAKTVESPTIALSETSYTYDGTAKEPTVTVKDVETTIPSTEYTVSYSNNTNVGTATVTITDVEGGNYVVSGSTTFTISSADGSLTPPTANSDLVYNGTAQDLITAGSTTTGTMEYSLDGTTYSTSIPQGTNAGSYTVYYRVKGDANHSDVAAQSFSVTITKATLSVSVGNYEMTEGEKIPSFTISYDGFVNNETVAVLTTVPTASCDATSESKPGTYAISISGGVADNYSFSYTAGTLTIKTKTTFKDDNSGGSEGEDDNSAEYTINESSGEENTVAITSDEGVKGSFSIPETVEHNGTSYKVTEIGEGAFENNTNLTAVSIPSSITSIGDKAFKNCSNLKSITVYITTPISLSGAEARRMMTRADGSSVFDGVDKATCILYVPEGSVELYKTAPVWSEFQIILAIGSTGINGIIKNCEPQDIYDLQGHKVKAKVTSFEGLPRGIYIVNGKKFVLK